MATTRTVSIGESLSLRITALIDTAGDAVTDASGYGCWFVVTDPRNNVEAVSNNLDLSTYSSSTGIVVTALAASDTAALNSRDYSYSLRIEAGDLVTDLEYGTLRVERQASILTSQPA